MLFRSYYSKNDTTRIEIDLLVNFLLIVFSRHSQIKPQRREERGSEKYFKRMATAGYPTSNEKVSVQSY